MIDINSSSNIETSPRCAETHPSAAAKQVNQYGQIRFRQAPLPPHISIFHNSNGFCTLARLFATAIRKVKQRPSDRLEEPTGNLKSASWA
jgi:hypothetical protein